MVLSFVEEARHERIEIGVRFDFGRVDVELTTANQARFLAQADHLLEEALEDVDPKPLPDAGQAGVVRQLLVEGVAQIPTVGEIEAGRLDQFALGADPFKEHHQLELDEDDRVNGRPTALSIELPCPLPDETEVERRLQVAVEIVSRNEVLE